ncbi:MAG: hypothetical protein RBT79_07950, partial [Chiayiivirga sp.]|nr:hypothetical protein [Chiayiivirga sp.]
MKRHQHSSDDAAVGDDCGVIVPVIGIGADDRSVQRLPNSPPRVWADLSTPPMSILPSPSLS